MSEEGYHPAPVSPVEQRVAALEALLTERGLVPEGFIDEITSRYELDDPAHRGDEEWRFTTLRPPPRAGGRAAARVQGHRGNRFRIRGSCLPGRTGASQGLV
jgi:hypothetical protein